MPVKDETQWAELVVQLMQRDVAFRQWMQTRLLLLRMKNAGLPEGDFELLQLEYEGKTLGERYLITYNNKFGPLGFKNEGVHSAR